MIDAVLSVQNVGEEFNCGMAQVYSILKSKESIMAMYESNASMKYRTSKYSEINEKLYEWYLLACSQNVYPDSLQLREKALQIAERLTLKDQTVGKRNGRNGKIIKRYHNPE